MKSKKKSSKAPWGANRLKDAGSHPGGAPARPMLAQSTTVPQPIDAPRSLVAAGVLLVAGAVWAYWPNLVEMVGIWESQPDYSHGYLVLPLALGLLWMRRDAYPVEGARPALVAGLLVVGLSVTIRLLAAKFFYGPVDTWSLLIWVAGTVLALWGWRVLWWALPSIFFLWFAMPLPFRVETMLRQPLQRLATELSSMVLVAFGQPAIAEANVIRIGDNIFGVDEACSGLRIFLGIAAFAFVLALLWRTSWVKRILLLLSILPVAIIANVTRIVTTCLLHEYVGSEAAQKFSHDAAGFVMIPFAAALLCLFLWLLNKILQEVAVVDPITIFRERGESVG